MKKSTLFLVAIPLAGLAFIAVSKYRQVQQIIKKMTADVKNISILGFTGVNIKIKIDILLVNNTPYALDFKEQGLVSLTKVELYNTSGIKLLESQTNISGIKINSYGQTIIKDLVMEGNFVNAIKEYFDNQFKGEYHIQPTLNVVNKQWVIS